MTPIEGFHSLGQHIFKSLGTKESVHIRKKMNFRTPTWRLPFHCFGASNMAAATSTAETEKSQGRGCAIRDVAHFVKNRKPNPCLKLYQEQQKYNQTDENCYLMKTIGYNKNFFVSSNNRVTDNCHEHRFLSHVLKMFSFFFLFYEIVTSNQVVGIGP